MTDFNFLKTEDSDNPQEEFEIITMADDLKQQAQKQQSQKSVKAPEKISYIPSKGSDFIEVKTLSQDSHPFLITILLLTILGSVITMAFAWWYMIYEPLKLASQPPILPTPQPQSPSLSSQPPQDSLPPPQSSLEPSLPRPPEPISKLEDLINVFFMEYVVNIDTAQPSHLFSLIEQEINKIKDKDVFVRVKINENSQPVSASKLFEKLEIGINNNFFNYIDGTNYNIFAYIDNNGIIRYGAVFSLKLLADNNIESTIQYLKTSENILIQEIEKIIENNNKDKKLKPAVSPLFNETNYKDINIRYYNFKKENFALDYAIFKNDKLVLFATSRDSMFAAIDRILKQYQAPESYPQPEILTPKNENDIIENNQENSQGSFQ